MTEKSISAEELEQRYADATVSNALTDEGAQELPPELQDFVDKLFELARTGTVPPGEPSAAEQLAGYVAAGLSPNLTNHEGNTLLMLAAYNGHADIVTALAHTVPTLTGLTTGANRRSPARFSSKKPP
jgi:hypothetical protein